MTDIICNDNLKEKCKITKNGKITTCTINEGIGYIIGGDFTNDNIDLIIFPNTVFNINQVPKFGGINIQISNDNPNFNNLKNNLYNYHGYEYKEECFIFNKQVYDEKERERERRRERGMEIVREYERREEERERERKWNSVR